MAEQDNWEYPDWPHQIPNPNDQSGGYDPGPNGQPGGGAPPGGGSQTPCPPGWERRLDGSCYDQTPCPQGAGWHRRGDNGECVNTFPGDDDPSTNGCGENQHWDEAAQRCVNGPKPGQQQQPNGAYQPPKPAAPTKSPYDAAMSQTLFDNLTRMINGEGAPFSPEMVARMQAAALQSNRSQLASGQRDVQRRLIASGLSRSGVAPATQARFRGAADVDLSNNLRSIATTAVQKNYEAKVTALNQAQAFLQSERANSLSQDQLILSYARLNQEWKTTQAQFDQQWKLVQSGNEQEMMKILLCLRTGAC